MALRNRIKGHRRVKVRDLVPHELNPRQHPEAQKEALTALLGEIGFARSVLAYELPDGRLKLIDGHLRRDTLGPDDEVDVEILDVTDDEARKLLLSIDPLAQLADYDDAALSQLRDTVQSDSETVQALWDALSANARSVAEQLEKAKGRGKKMGGNEEGQTPENFRILIDCDNERQQVDRLRQLKRQGWVCKALTS